MLRQLAAVSIGALIVGASSVAQTLPNFGGTWELDAARSNPTETTAATVVIVQTADAVTIEQHGFGVKETITYPFKSAAAVLAAVGTIGNNPSAAAVDLENAAVIEARSVDAPGGITGVQASGAEWKDGALETIAVLAISGKSLTVRTRRTLNAAGEMTVERTLGVQHGYETGDAHGATQDIYVKRASAAPAR